MLCTACRDNIFDFMHQRLGVPRDQAEAVWRPLFKQTNQSLKVGLPGHSTYVHPEQHACGLRQMVRTWVFGVGLMQAPRCRPEMLTLPAGTEGWRLCIPD